MPNPYDDIPLAAGSAKASANPYDAILDGDAAAIRGSLVNAMQANPDTAAKATRIARQVGAPPSAVEAHLPEVESGLKVDYYSKMIERAPKTGDLLRHPDVARMAHDDVETLSGWEQTAQFLKNSGKALVSGVPAFNEGFWGVGQAGAEMLSKFVTGPMTGTILPEDIGAKMAQGFSNQRQISKSIREGMMPKGGGNLESGWYSGLQSMVSSLLTLPAAVASGNPELALAPMAATTGGQAYGEARDKGVAVGQSLAFGASQAAIEYATEKLPVSWLLKDLKAGAGFGKVIAHQMASEIPGEQVATAMQDLNEWATLNPEKPFVDYLKARPDAAVQTLVATIVGTAGQSGAIKLADVVLNAAQRKADEANQSAQAGELLAGMNKLAEASKVRARDPDTARAFFQSVLADGNDSVWITTDALAQSGLAEQMAQAIPAVAEQLETAAAAGHDIRIPVADLMANMAGTELEQALLPHVSTTPGGFTPTTAQEYLQSGQAEELRTEMSRLLGAKEQDDAFQTSAQEVEDAVFAELQKAGRHAESVNRADAMLHRHFFSVMAAKIGEAPKALFDRFALRVVAQATGGRQLQQGANDYQIEHKPMTVAGGASTMDDLLPAFGEDIYGKDALQFFGSGDSREAKAVRIMKSVRGKPGAMVTIYRGVPDGVDKINPGDWVTLVKEAADDYASQHEGGKVVSMKVPAAHVTSWSDSLLEFGYHPPEQVLNQSAIPETITINGVERSTTNSNGKPIAQDEASIRRFYEWFGDSQVVDEQGRPLVVYHGTSNDFARFNLNKLGANTLGEASSEESGQTSRLGHWFSSHPMGRSPTNYGAGYSTDMPAYLRIANQMSVEENDDLAVMLEGGKKGSALRRDLASQGYDGVFIKRDTEFDGSSFVAFSGSQIKSATGNNGQFSSTDASIVRQDNRGAFNPATNTISLLAGADLSTFLHESGHFFLEVQTAMAAEIAGNAAVYGDESLTDGERSIMADTQALMDWFGLEDLNAWDNLDFEARRSYHEQFARGFEAYLFEGKAPSIEMQGLFQRFGAWLSRVYKSLKALNVELTPEVRAVFDRMLATEEQIKLAEQGRAMLDLFQTQEQSGMSPADFAAYQALGAGATAAAAQELQARGLRDLQWIKNAKARELTRLRVESKAKRAELEIEARREVMSQPVYRAWQFLTAKIERDDMEPFERAQADYRDAVKASDEKRKAAAEQARSAAKQEVWESSEEGRVKYRRAGTLAKAQAKVLRREDREIDAIVDTAMRAWDKANPAPAMPTDQSAAQKSDPNVLDETRDSLFVAIAKLGGINKAEVVSAWGIDPADKPRSGIVGKPLWRTGSDGLSIDGMAEALTQYGYLPTNENDQWDIRDFEELFGRELKGDAQYSTAYDVGAAQQPPKAGEEIINPAGLRAARLNIDGLSDTTLTREQIALLKKRRMTARSGLHPDVAADIFPEYDSGDALVTALAEAVPPKVAIDAIVDQRMLEQFGELATPEAIEKAADSAIFNEARARAISTELAALDTANRVRSDAGTDNAGRRRTFAVLPKVAQEYAAALMSRLRLRDIFPGQYASAATRAAKDAVKAEKAGDIEAAAAAKRTQLLNHYTTRAAYDAQVEAAKIDAFFKRILSAKDDSIKKSRDFDLVSAARAVLAAYGYGAKAQAAVEYVKRVQENDQTWMADVIRKAVEYAEANGKPIKDLTMDELRALYAEVDGLWHLAQRNRKMEIDGKLMDRDVVAELLINRMKDIGIPATAPGVSSAITPEEQIALNIASITAFGKRVEFWVDLKDGDVKIGVFRRYLWQPIKEAADRYRAEKADRLRAFRALFDGIAPSMKRGLIDAHEIGYTFGKDSGGVAMNELLHAILHTGNESNKRKLLLGRKWAELLADGSIDTARWDAFIDRMQRSGVLTKAHYDFAQSVWDMLESMKPAAQKAHRDATGKYFDEVTANEVNTPFGTYRGGYVPAKVDGRIVQDMALKKLIEEGADGMSYTFPNTPKGFTKARVEYNEPLHLDLRLLPQHIDSVLLFTHLELPTRDAARLLGFNPLRTALDRQDPGAINSVLIPWLNRSARQQVTTPVPGGGWPMKVLNAVRNRTGMAYMFANVSNAVQQIGGLPMALTKVKPTSLALSLAQYIKAPRQTAEAVAALSPYMHGRMSNEVAAMRGDIEAILLDPTLYERAKEWTNRHAYFLQSAVDSIIGPIVWKAAYDEALSEHWDTADAARIADAAIRQTQGSTLAEDVSRLETGPAYGRIFTQFTGYFIMQGNLIGSGVAKVSQEIGLKKGAGRALGVLLAGFYAPAVVAELVAQLFRGGPGDDDKDGSYLDDWMMALFVWGPMRNSFAMVPFAGQIGLSATARFNDNPMDDRVSLSPVVGAIEAGAGVPYDMFRIVTGEGNASRSIKDVATLVSLVTGLPAHAVARPISYLAGVAQGKTDPTGPVDAARGVITGAASPESRGR
jgi:hypothetical protein